MDKKSSAKNEWIEAKKKLVKELDESGEYRIERDSEGIITEVFGRCPDCGLFRSFNFDHLTRRSQGGRHNKSNLELVCSQCHQLRDQGGDPMNKKKGNKKVGWQKAHPCVACGKTTSLLICHHCNKLSIKK